MNLSVLKWLGKKTGKISAFLVVAILINAVLSIIGVRFALVSKELIDIVTKQSDGKISASFATIAVYLTIQILLIIFGNLLDIRIRGKLEIKIRRDLFCSLLKKDLKELSSFHSGELMNRLTSDVNVVVSGIADILPTFVSLTITILLSAYYLFILAPTFALWILPIGPIVLILGRLYSRKMKTLHKRCQEADGKTRSFMQELLQNVIAVKAFRAENAVSSDAQRYQLSTYKVKVKRNAVATFAGVGLYIVFTAGYYITLGWGALKISAGALTYGTLIAMLRLVSQIQTPFRNMSSLLSKAFSTIASAERIIELENLKDEIPAAENLGTYDKIESLCVDNLTYSYNTAPLIKDSNLVMNQGEFVAISGISGIGKSTLLKLLLGLYSPNEGSIYLNVGGKAIPVGSDTRAFFSYVPQENMILSGTIKDNIRFYNENASDKDVLRCASIACVDEFVSELENGYDTVLHEGGAGLSGGQIQRIAIARALIHDSPILLLDEATSALDEETEKKVLKNIKSLTDKCCIIVSHKSAALDICDKVVRIEDCKFICEDIKND